MAFMTCSSPESVRFASGYLQVSCQRPPGGAQLHDPRALPGRAAPLAAARPPYGASHFR
jgi:hypothetical protein